MDQTRAIWIKDPLAILADGAERGIVVQNGRIAERVPAGREPVTANALVYEAGGHVVLPGLINTHHHFYQTLTRALPAALDRELFPWLTALYPVWARLTPEALDLGVTVAMSELLLSGCTTTTDHHYVFPAGLEDCLAATEWVVAHGEELGASRVFVAGDSAGGTMAAVVALLLRDKGVTGLAGQILIYPVTAYYDPPSASYLEMAEGYGLTRKGMMWFWDHYLKDKSEGADFRAAPLMADSLRGLPRAFVATAEYDVLRDEGLAYAKRLEEAGVEVTQVFAEGMNHGFACSISEFPFLPQAKDLLRKVAEWIAAV